ncbi:MAG: hypothetical protein ACLQI7_01430, partial [Streptosporangiaceae bacterium]
MTLRPAASGLLPDRPAAPPWPGRSWPAWSGSRESPALSLAGRAQAPSETMNVRHPKLTVS